MKLKYFILAFFTSLLLIYCSKSDEPVEEKSYTAIPNYYFQKALIELNIDSDGEIDGKVLTSDISSISTLVIREKNIGNLIGIEDFKSLKYLDAGENFITELDISKNLDLIQLNLSGGGYNWGSNNHNEITYLDVSKNTSLREIIVNYKTTICIKVNQEQLDNLTGWGWGYWGTPDFMFDYRDVFQLDCD